SRTSRRRGALHSSRRWTGKRSRASCASSTPSESARQSRGATTGDPILSVATATAATAAAALHALLSLVHFEVPAVQRGAVQLRDGVVRRRGAAHGDERKAARLPG